MPERIHRHQWRHSDRWKRRAQHLDHVDGVMLGRAAYHTPGILAASMPLLRRAAPAAFDFAALIETMAAYAARHIEQGGRLGHVTRHMVGLFHGLPGARRYRQILSTDATRPGAGPRRAERRRSRRSISTAPSTRPPEPDSRSSVAQDHPVAAHVEARQRADEVHAEQALARACRVRPPSPTCSCARCRRSPPRRSRTPRRAPCRWRSRPGSCS